MHLLQSGHIEAEVSEQAYHDVVDEIEEPEAEGDLEGEEPEGLVAIRTQFAMMAGVRGAAGGGVRRST